MNTTCIGCGADLADFSDSNPEDGPAVKGDAPGRLVCDHESCREILRLKRQIDSLEISNLQQTASLAALKTIFVDLNDPNTEIPAEVSRKATPVCDYIDERIEWHDSAERYYFYLAIARHVDAAMLNAREELEAAA